MDKRANTFNRATGIAGIVLFVSVAGCDHKSQEQAPGYGTAAASSTIRTYRFAVHPLHNPSKMNQAYEPLVAYLNKRAQEFRLELEASRDYGNYEAKIKTRRAAFLLPNPWQSLQAMKVGYTVIAMAGEPQDFKGIFLVRRDSTIQEPSDVKGKTVSYPSRTALAACIMPQFFLHHHGVDVNTEIENRYVGSQESSIMNAYLKITAIAVTWPPPWRAFQKDHPAEAAQLKVLWETPFLVNNAVMARTDIPMSVREQVRELLLGLHDSPEGRSILEGMETARFLPASDASYEVVREYVANFEKEVRPVEIK